MNNRLLPLNTLTKQGKKLKMSKKKEDRIQRLHWLGHIDFVGVSQSCVQVGRHERHCELAENRVKVHVAGHAIGDLDQSFQKNLIFVF